MLYQHCNLFYLSPIGILVSIFHHDKQCKITSLHGASIPQEQIARIRIVKF